MGYGVLGVEGKLATIWEPRRDHHAAWSSNLSLSSSGHDNLKVELQTFIHNTAIHTRAHARREELIQRPKFRGPNKMKSWRELALPEAHFARSPERLFVGLTSCIPDPRKIPASSGIF